MESYGRFAGVYDVFMDNVNYREWADYIIETLAQVFTEVRYKKSDNECMSVTLKETLKKQGFEK